MTAQPLVLPLATRGSALARWQADHVAHLLAAAAAADGGDLRVEPVVIETTADQRLDIPIWEMGGKGVFVKQIQAALLDGRARIAVHSGKDLPATTHPDLVIAAVPERADPRDVLVGSTLADLVPGATVATGSVRRRVQLASARPDLTFEGLRGNIATRLDRIPAGGAIVMARAALDRLDLLDGLTLAHETFEPSTMLPQVAQGTLAVECRVDDKEVRALLAALDHRPSRLAFDAERAFLAELGGDCDLPAGAFATVAVAGGADSDVPATIRLDALLASLDGHTIVRAVHEGTDPTTLGTGLARHLLDDCGGTDLLDR
jgi:hydroxymethylbilane synthase